MKEQQAYVRIYWSIIDDPKFVEVYDNDAALATWVRLLISADASWPASAEIPASARKAPLTMLVSAGIVDLVHGHRYRIHGLDAERNARSDAGRNAAAMRWHSAGNADPMPSRAEPSRAKPSLAPAPAREGLPNLNSAVSKTWEDATGRAVIGSGQFAIEYLDDACRRYPAYEVAAAIIRARQTFDHIPAAQPLIVAVRSILDPLPDAKGAAAKAAEVEESRRRRRAVESTLAGNHALGAHAAEAHPRCPSCNAGPVIVQ